MVIASMSQNIALPLSVVEVEAVAAVRALEFSLEIRISSIVIEGDLELVINSLKDESPSFASFDLLIRDAKILTIFL